MGRGKKSPRPMAFFLKIEYTGCCAPAAARLPGRAGLRWAPPARFGRERRCHGASRPGPFGRPVYRPQLGDHLHFHQDPPGGVYPCDFYVLDEWRLGTVGKQPLEEMERSEVARRFVEQSHRVPQRCKECPVYPICRNGCRRDREVLEGGEIDLNYYCQAYFSFFTQRKRELYQAVQLILNRQRNL